jgi:putative transposase
MARKKEEKLRIPGMSDEEVDHLVDTVRSPEAEAGALHALEEFSASPLGKKHPQIQALWRRHWERVAPAPAYPLQVRRMLYSTISIESLHHTVRKSLKVRGHFPTDESASKLIYLALRNAQFRFGTPKGWREAMQHPCCSGPSTIS